MRVFEIQSFGLEHLKMVDRPDPQPGPGEVRVRLRAASLNYRDLLMVQGKYNPHLKLPIIPLSDGAGEIEAVGPGARGVQVGDRVAGLFTRDWIAGEPDRDMLRSTLGGPLDGMLAESIVLPAHGVLPIPDHLSFEEAATLPCAGLTAWSALCTYGGVRAGDTVLILGTGGVSIFALQFARLLGARTIVTSSSDEKLERARKLGADEIINYNEKPAWEKEVYRLTGKRGVDHVIEVGGAGTLEKSIRCTRPGGRISLIGILAGGAKDLNLLPILMQNISVQGIIVGHREGFQAMNRAVAQHEIRPIVDRVFPFEESVEALSYLKSGAHFGKICITI